MADNVTDLPPVIVWLVKDGALRVYSNGKEIAAIPKREFANLGVAICQELRG
jgi:hypothetical protein